MKVCRWHERPVLDDRAILVAVVPRTSGPDVPVYACDDCVKRLGLIPLEQHPVGSSGAPRFGGRPDAPPIPPERSVS